MSFDDSPGFPDRLPDIKARADLEQLNKSLSAIHPLCQQLPTLHETIRHRLKASNIGRCRIFSSAKVWSEWKDWLEYCAENEKPDLELYIAARAAHDSLNHARADKFSQVVEERGLEAWALDELRRMLSTASISPEECDQEDTINLGTPIRKIKNEEEDQLGFLQRAPHFPTPTDSPTPAITLIRTTPVETMSVSASKVSAEGPKLAPTLTTAIKTAITAVPAPKVPPTPTNPNKTLTAQAHTRPKTQAEKDRRKARHKERRLKEGRPLFPPTPVLVTQDAPVRGQASQELEKAREPSPKRQKFEYVSRGTQTEEKPRVRSESRDVEPITRPIPNMQQDIDRAVQEALQRHLGATGATAGPSNLVVPHQLTSTPSMPGNENTTFQAAVRAAVAEEMQMQRQMDAQSQAFMMRGYEMGRMAMGMGGSMGMNPRVEELGEQRGSGRGQGSWGGSGYTDSWDVTRTGSHRRGY